MGVGSGRWGTAAFQSPTYFQTSWAISATVCRTPGEGGRSYATHSPSAPSVCAPDSWSGFGKEVKVRGGGGEEVKVPRAAEQKPRTRRMGALARHPG